MFAMLPSLSRCLSYGDNVDSRCGVRANLQMHLCERLGNPAKFVRVSEAVNGQPDLPARPCIPQKPAGVPVRLCAYAKLLTPVAPTSLPTQPALNTVPLHPSPKNFWLQALRETGSDLR